MKDYRPLLLVLALVVGGIFLLDPPKREAAPEPPPPSQPAPAAKIRLLIFCIDGCAPCARLHAALKEPDVQKALERFDVQDADPSQGGEYQIQGYPTLVALTEAGPVKKVGFTTSADFISWLNSVR